VRIVAAAALLLCAPAIATAQMTSTPPAKRAGTGQSLQRQAQPIAIPEQLSPPQEAFAAFPEPATAVSSAPSTCQLRLTKLAVFRPLPVLIGPGECGATDVVLLDSVILPDQTNVALGPAATLRCTMAEQIARWVREDVAPSAVKLGSALSGLDNYDSYECRGRNRVRGATLSEHGRANALDIRGIKLADGRTIGLTDVNVGKSWREGLKASACARFSTVLGPGSDGEHEEHIHVDLAERRNNFKLCQWDVREPALQAKATTPGAEEAEGLSADESAMVPA